MHQKKFLLFIFSVIVFSFVFLLPIKPVSAAQTSKITFIVKPNPPWKDEIRFNISTTSPFGRINDNYTTTGLRAVINNLALYNKYTIKLSAPFSSSKTLTFDGGKNPTFEVKYTPPTIPLGPNPTLGPPAPAPAGTNTAPASTPNNTGTNSPGSVSGTGEGTTEENATRATGSTDFSSNMEAINLPTYGPTTWPQVGKMILDFMGWIVGTIFVGVLLIGGVMYITAGSNEQGAETGKKAIFAAIIGIAVTALAWTIITFVAGIIK